MSDRPARILPAQLATEVEMFIDNQFASAAKYDNSEVLDESGAFDLHTLSPGLSPGFAAAVRGETVTGTRLVVDVEGAPAPKGSKDFKGMRGGKPILVEHSPILPAWTAAIVAATQARRRLTGHVTFTGPCDVDIWCYFPRPKSAPDRPYPCTRHEGDGDKLARAVNDALTLAGVWTDDSLAADIHIHKRYSRTGVCGARIVIDSMEDA